MEATTRSIRKKIWQIPSGYHCSIIGICLSRGDLRQLSRKNSFEIRSSMSDYVMHNMLSSLVKIKSQQSRVLHKILDRKYRVSIKKYLGLNSPENLLEQWEHDFQTGEVSGPYWAVMTHPLTNSAVINRIYGDCHMQSFDCFSRQKAENRLVENYRKANKRLQDQVESGKSANFVLREQQQINSKQVEEISAELKDIKQLNKGLMHRIPELQKTEELREQLDKAQQHIAALKCEAEQVLTQKLQLEHTISSLGNIVQRQEMKIESDALLIAQQADEIAILEDMAASTCLEESVCNNCVDGCSCPLNHQLSGKRVLYVGGHHKMVAHYKQVVEHHGAEFLYHDGGRESSKHILPKLLSGADAVFCPVDCISHDACKCVKKICKRESKPFVMMRSSGVSSLVKSLNEMRQ